MTDEEREKWIDEFVRIAAARMRRYELECFLKDWSWTDFFEDCGVSY